MTRSTIKSEAAAVMRQVKGVFPDGARGLLPFAEIFASTEAGDDRFRLRSQAALLAFNSHDCDDDEAPELRAKMLTLIDEIVALRGNDS